MIRGWLCLAVIIVATALASPALSNSLYVGSSANPSISSQSFPDPGNVTALNTAFNYSLSSANIFTNATAKWTQPINATELKFFSTVTDTHTGNPIPNTAFNYTVNSTHSPTHFLQQVGWNITVPQTNCGLSCTTFVSFTLLGNLTKGTSENFTVTKGATPIESGIFQGNDTTFRPICTLAKGNNATVCGPTVKVPVGTYAGSNVTLSFFFGWNATGMKLKASVGEIAVESLANTTTASTSSVMTQTPGNTVTHYATFTSVTYNTTNSVKPWSTEVIDVFYPNGFNLTQIQINQTGAPSITIFPLTSPHKLFNRESCNDSVECSQSLIALNMSDIISGNVLHSSTIYVTALTENSVSQVSTLSGGVQTQVFTAGDRIGIDVLNKPSIVNASTSEKTGNLIITFNSALSILPDTVQTAVGGVFTFSLPSSCGTAGQLCARNWNYSVTFSSQFDLGNRSGSFRMDLLKVKSFSSTGGSNSLNVQGALEYGNGTAAAGVNATLFSIDTGTPVNTPFTKNQTTTPGSGTPLYITNVTLVDPVFTQGQTLIMLFTIINHNPSQAYNATLTISHLWPGPQSHNVSITYLLGPGDPLNDLPITSTSSQNYEAQISFTGSGVQVVLTNLRTSTPWPARTMTVGTSPVVPNRPHGGLFNITIISTINGAIQTPSSWILTPTYAYVAPSMAPARYLYGSPAIKTDPNGAFSATVNDPRGLLGAKNLTVFVLARDASGIVVVNNLPSSGFLDSTTLITKADTIAPVEKGQMGTATLHLTSNSTASNGITQVITIIAVVQGNGITPYEVGVATGITIAPGATVTVSVPFTAPQNTGTYSLTYSSPQYGGILASQSLQVTILQGSLQLLIPAGIAVAAAIIVLGYYLVRGRGATSEEVEKPKTKGPMPKPKAAPDGNPPAKSLTQTGEPYR